MTGSLLLAGGVVAAAAWLGTPPPAAPAEGPGTMPATPMDLTGLDVNPADLQAGGQRLALESIEQFEVFQDDGKTITRLTGAEANPREDFVADIREPRAEITFAPERVLTIAAAEGTFYYPGREPQRGEFHRDTVVTLYEARTGETVDMQSDRHVQMRLYLDEPTHFDREQGQVRTDGPVRLVGRDVDFAGRGLSLTFNAGQQRVEQLVIDHGEQLRLAAGGATAGDTGPAEDAAADAGATAGGKAPAPTGTVTPAADASGGAAGQSYLVTLDGGVDVTVGADGTTLRGQTLRGSFVVRADSDSDPAGDDEPDAAPAPGAGMQASIAADPPADSPAPTAEPTAPPRTATAPPVNAGDPRALRRPRPDDTVVTWRGRLVLIPDPLPAPDAGGGPGTGTRLVLRGGDDGPAQVVTGDAQRLEAARVGYDADSGRVWAHANGHDTGDASDGAAITLVAPDVGRLTARGLELSRATGIGLVTGPGRLDTVDGRLAVAFTRQLDLRFAAGDDPNDSDAQKNPAAAFAGLQEATFVGSVAADATDADGRPSLSLRADRLTVPFVQDAENAGSGATSVEPSTRPAALIATADPSTPDQPVTATLPGTRFSADELTVDLVRAEPVRTEEAETPGDAGPPTPEGEPSALGGLDVARVRARGAVSVQLDAGEADLTAHALDADPGRQRLELFGRGDVPAVLVRRGARLQGAHLILREADQAAEALGPGRFSAPTDPQDPDAEIRVAWTGGMTFENRAGRAFFTGGVTSESEARESRTRLSTHELSIDFEPQDLDAVDGEGVAETEAGGNAEAGDADATAGRDALDIRRVHALADPQDGESLVNFTTQTLEAGPQREPGADEAEADPPALTAFTLISRELNFVNVVPNLDNRTAVDDRLTLQTVEVPGRGRMLISDYRLPEAGDGGDSAVAFAGAGLTAFAWEGRLTLDALQNDLRMEGDVLMAHEPLSGPGAGPNGQADPPIKLEAQVLTADLTETGGLGALAGGPAPAAQLRRVVGAGAVRISRDQTRALADHLDYTAARRTVILTAEPGKLCELRQADQPGAATTARRLVWDLDTGVFTAEGVGGGVVPIE